ncbi:MAG: hypothetical protein ABJL67_09450 [Sulfitobacter sp.]
MFGMKVEILTCTHRRHVVEAQQWNEGWSLGRPLGTYGDALRVPSEKVFWDLNIVRLTEFTNNPNPVSGKHAICLCALYKLGRKASLRLEFFSTNSLKKLGHSDFLDNISHDPKIRILLSL